MANTGKRRSAITIDAATGKPEVPPVKDRDRTRLDTPQDVLKELRRLYRRAKCERQPVTTLAWLLGEVRKTMELVEVADQVERLKAIYARVGAPDLTSLPAPEVPQARVSEDAAHRYVGD